MSKFKSETVEKNVRCRCTDLTAGILRYLRFIYPFELFDLKARVYTKVFPNANYNAASNGVESWWEFKSNSLYESSLNYHILVKRGWESMRVEKREFVWEFSQLSCPGQTRIRDDESWKARVCIRVFLTIMSWSNEDESWELRSEVCMRVFSTIMSWSNKDESWWELRSKSLYESFLNYHVLVKQGWELMRVETREFAWEFS